MVTEKLGELIVMNVLEKLCDINQNQNREGMKDLYFRIVGDKLNIEIHILLQCDEISGDIILAYQICDLCFEKELIRLQLYSIAVHDTPKYKFDISDPESYMDMINIITNAVKNVSANALYRKFYPIETQQNDS